MKGKYAMIAAHI